MSLRLRQLHLRVQTEQGLYGTRIPFGDGLTLLRADNNMGKSTCVQAIIYALGLEKMLGPSSAIPLPHVMTKYVEENGRELPVLESEVLLEIENHKGEFLTIQRSATGTRDTRLVSTWAGPKLSNPDSPFAQRDYFVRDPGAAQHEAGFFKMFADFLGWSLPTVRKFNGAECPLYLETIFPLFIVEQKHGWSGIQANLPTFFGIREMAKRTVEFVLDLDSARLAEERQRLEYEEADLRNRWKNLVSLVSATLRGVNGRVVGLPEQPTAQWPLAIAPTIEVFRNNAWISATDTLATNKRELLDLQSTPVPTADEAAPRLAEALESSLKVLTGKEVIAGELLEDLSREKMQLDSIEVRLAALAEDLQRNKDAAKLRTFGSVAKWSLMEHTCPTCQQNLADTLFEQGVSENPMPLEENITFIQNQLNTFTNLRDNSSRLVAKKTAELATVRTEMDELRREIRSLRQTLVAPNNTPSIDAIRQRLDLEGKVQSLEKAIQEFSESMESYEDLATEWKALLERRRALPADGLSSEDKTKLSRLGELLREQLADFGFSSLRPETIEISHDTYRPTREGFDLGFDLSASDNIRTIWAYLEGLLELASEKRMNHLGCLLFDEPRQQEAAEVSFERLLKRAAGSRDRNQQVVFATSEPLASIERMTQGLSPKVVSFEGRVIKKMA